MGEKITVYISDHCQPCQEVKREIEEKGIANVELVNVESAAGFRQFTEEVLNKGDGAVPSAYKDGQKCKMGYDETNQLVIECPDSTPPTPSTET